MTYRQIRKIELLDAAGNVVDFTAHVFRGKAVFGPHQGPAATVVAVRITRSTGEVVKQAISERLTTNGHLALHLSLT